MHGVLTSMLVGPMRAWRPQRSGRRLQLSWPPDPLTQLVMQADGVTEAELRGLLQRVAAARTGV